MKEVIIIGAGGHAAEIDDYIKYSQSVTGKRELNVIGFLDDNPGNYASYRRSAPLLGGIKDHKVVPGQAYIIGIANLKYRRLFVERFLNEGAVFVSFIHPSAYVSESATVGEGSIVGPNANLGPNVRREHTKIALHMGHDTVVGDFNFISPTYVFRVTSVKMITLRD